MAYDTTHTQSTYALASAAFDYDCDNANFPDASSSTGLTDEPTANGNAPNWQWTDDTSPSSSTGPPASNGGCVFPESSSPMAANDISMATLVSGNEVDASLYLLYVDVDLCTYGNTNGGVVVQAYDGGTWNTIASQSGNSTTSFTAHNDLDCTSYTNSDFSVRIVATMASSGNVYQCDYAFQNLRIHGADSAADPEITNAGDETYTVYETNITVTGTDFGTQTGSYDLELGDSATYGSANLESQSIDSWADTSIQFDLTIGALDVESLWLYVTDSAAVVSNAWAVTVDLTPNITDVGDEYFDYNEANVTITGSEFLNAQGTGKVELCNNATYASGAKVTQSIDTWATGSIQFDVVTTGRPEADLWVFVTNSKGFINATGYSIEIDRIPLVTNVEDEIIANNETGVVMDGSGFLPAKGTGLLELTDSATYIGSTKVTQTDTNWDEDEIIFTVVKGGWTSGTYYLFVTNDQSNVSATGYEITLTAPPPEPLYQTSNIQASITNSGLTTTIFLISDE